MSEACKCVHAKFAQPEDAIFSILGAGVPWDSEPCLPTGQQHLAQAGDMVAHWQQHLCSGGLEAGVARLRGLWQVVSKSLLRLCR